MGIWSVSKSYKISIVPKHLSEIELDFMHVSLLQRPFLHFSYALRLLEGQVTGQWTDCSDRGNFKEAQCSDCVMGTADCF